MLLETNDSALLVTVPARPFCELSLVDQSLSSETWSIFGTLPAASPQFAGTFLVLSGHISGTLRSSKFRRAYQTFEADMADQRDFEAAPLPFHLKAVPGLLGISTLGLVSLVYQAGLSKCKPQA